MPAFYNRRAECLHRNIPVGLGVAWRLPHVAAAIRNTVVLPCEVGPQKSTTNLGVPNTCSSAGASAT
jgi:hypothetical protein